MSMLEPHKWRGYNVLSLSTMKLETKAGDEVISTGSGFVVVRGRTPYLITNRHVLVGRKPPNDEYADRGQRQPTSVRILHHTQEEPGAVWKEERTFNDDLDGLWLEHPVHRNRMDIVALPLRDLEGILIHPVSLEPPNIGEAGSTDPLAPYQIHVAVSQPVFVIGYPLGLDGGRDGVGIWTQGTIASELSLDIDGLPRFLIDSRTRQGLSGAPVYYYPDGAMTLLKSGGEVVFKGVISAHVNLLMGIYSGRVDSESDLGYVWKSEAIAEIVNNGVPGKIT